MAISRTPTSVFWPWPETFPSRLCGAEYGPVTDPSRRAIPGRNHCNIMKTSFHKGWMSAPLDGMAWSGYTRAQKQARCKEMAAESREAVFAAEKALGEWRKSA